MTYCTDMEGMLRKIDPASLVRMLEPMGYEHLAVKRGDIWIGRKRSERGEWQVTVPLDRSLADYGEAMHRVLKTVASSEEMLVADILRKLIPADAFMDRHVFLTLLEGVRDGGSVSVGDVLSAAQKSVAVYVFGGWNPYPEVSPPENRKLRVTLRCIAGSRKCRDAVYLASKPEAYTRLDYTSPGWYMSLTGKRIEDGKVAAWMAETPYRG